MVSTTTTITKQMLRGRGLLEGRHLASYDASPGETTTAEQSSDNTAKNYASRIKNGTSDLASTHPREWTDHQFLSVATGVVSLWTLVMMIVFCKGCCERRSKKKLRQEDDAYMNMSVGDNKEALLKAAQEDDKSHQMVRPFVTKGVCGGAYGGDYDASDANQLPLGARLHGAHKLREDGLTGTGVRVGIIDSGIDHTHPGLHDTVRARRWFRKGTPLEEDDHGTHVAGTIHFMAPDADLYDYRVFGNEGDFDGDAAIAKSIRSAVDVDKCQVINMSLRCSYPVRPEIKKAIKYAYKKGVHLVCAAGNDGDGNLATDELYTFPARFDETISVAAVCKERGLPATSFSESNPGVTYSGIGKDVVSLKPFGGLQTMSGTSMATPHVTGLIACLLSENSNSSSNFQNTYSDAQLRKTLKQKYLVDIGPKGYDKQTGEGFVTYLASSGNNNNNSEEVFDLLSLVEQAEGQC